MADLSGVLAKLDRADEHRQAYEDLLEEFLGSEPYSIFSEYDSTGVRQCGAGRKRTICGDSCTGRSYR